MGYLDIHNKSLSGNTFRIYLSDYGKNLLSSGGGFFSAVSKFGLSDSDIDYRRFVGDGDCVSQTSLSALTGSCFYDLPDLRSGEPTSFSGSYGSTPSVMVGPVSDIVSGVMKLYDTSVGVNPVRSTLWSKYKKPENVDEVEEPQSGMFSNCWTVGESVAGYFPSYCTTCADFNGDGIVGLDDLKTLLQMMGSSVGTTNELIGDFNGDGKVDGNDLTSFINCMRHNGTDINSFCSDKEVFCLLCEHLGESSPCNGDCLGCI